MLLSSVRQMQMMVDLMELFCIPCSQAYTHKDATGVCKLFGKGLLEKDMPVDSWLYVIRSDM